MAKVKTFDGLDVTLAGETLQAMPGGALWWPTEDALLVADVHLGRAAARRAAGMVSPEGTDAADLARLGELLCSLGARQCVILGDLIHAPAGLGDSMRERLGAFFTAHPQVAFRLIEGNHDRRARRFLESVNGLELRPRLILGPLYLTHEPAEPVAPAAYTLCGHLHPGVELGDASGCRIRQKCFHLGKSIGVLPAFGATTSCGAIDVATGDRVIGVDAERVMEIPLPLSPGRGRGLAARFKGR